MVERICPQCQVGNSLENRFCGHCGTNMEEVRALPHQETNLAKSGAALPAEFKQVGKALAVSLAALAAEASLAWLRQRVEHVRKTAPTSKQTHPVTQITRSATAPVAVPTPPNTGVTVWSQRVVQTWEQGHLIRQTVERSVWKREG